MLKFFRKIRQNLLSEGKTGKYLKYAIGEIVLVVIGILIALSINNWNENRRNAYSENKVLTEISNGLEKDLLDIKENVTGHKIGISACKYFRSAFLGNKIETDSLLSHYFSLTRDYITIQNIAGYETLKSKGLEIIKNDSLRLQIISLYEYNYNTLRKLEEEYYELQFQENYFKEINEELAPNFKIDKDGMVRGIDLPLKITENKRNKLILYTWKIQYNRSFILREYAEIETKINEVKNNINAEIKR